MKDFIKIGEDRIRKNTVKKYKPIGDLKVMIYYNTSRYKIESESFAFMTKGLRDEFIEELDQTFVL